MVMGQRGYSAVLCLASGRFSCLGTLPLLRRVLGEVPADFFPRQIGSFGTVQVQSPGARKLYSLSRKQPLCILVFGLGQEHRHEAALGLFLLPSGF